MPGPPAPTTPFAVTFSGEVVWWRGPSPYHFVSVPDPQLGEVEGWSFASYGWGCIPVRGVIGSTAFRTSLFPREGGFLVPVKADVRRSEGVELGDRVTVQLELVTDALS